MTSVLVVDGATVVGSVPNGWWKDPWPINLVENMATVQWMHRVLATALLLGAIAFLIKVRRDAELAQLHHWSAALAGLLLVF